MDIQIFEITYFGNFMIIMWTLHFCPFDLIIFGKYILKYILALIYFRSSLFSKSPCNPNKISDKIKNRNAYLESQIMNFLKSVIIRNKALKDFELPETCLEVNMSILEDIRYFCKFSYLLLSEFHTHNSE